MSDLSLIVYAASEVGPDIALIILGVVGIVGIIAMLLWGDE